MPPRVTDRAAPVPMPSNTERSVPVAMPQAPGPDSIDLTPITTDRALALDSAITAASTAKGFAAPQAFPVMPPPMARAPVVLDVTPRGLGIGTVAGYCEELIRRNSRVPTEIRKLFTTSRDAQDAVRIIVCQGESRRLGDNVVIGDLRLENLPARPRGETSIEVTFQLDASGILNVRARDAHTGAEQRASLDVVGSIPDADVAASRDRLQALRR
jgi:molecular chaperone DnaK